MVIFSLAFRVQYTTAGKDCAPPQGKLRRGAALSNRVNGLDDAGAFLGGAQAAGGGPDGLDVGDVFGPT